MHMLRALAFIEARHKFVLRPVYINTVHNNHLSDDLSCDNLSSFLTKFPKAHRHPDPPQPTLTLLQQYSSAVAYTTNILGAEPFILWLHRAYTIDICWRIVWLYTVQQLSPWEMANLACVNERTVGRYITLFQQTGDVQPITRRFQAACFIKADFFKSRYLSSWSSS